MDPLFTPSSPPPQPAFSSSGGFPVTVIVAIGLFVTAFLLIGYYLIMRRLWLTPTHPVIPRANSSTTAGNRALDAGPAVFLTDDFASQRPEGVDQSIINAIPVIKYARARDAHRKKKKPAKVAAASRSFRACAVCLNDFQEKESLKFLPTCSHAFHVECIDTWLQSNVSCPLCRTVITFPGSDDFAFVDYVAAGEFSRELSRTAEDHHPEAGGKWPGDPIRRSFSMDFFVVDARKRKLDSASQRADLRIGPTPETQESSPAVIAGNNNNNGDDDAGGGSVAGDVSGRFRRLFHSFRLGRSSRSSSVLPL